MGSSVRESLVRIRKKMNDMSEMISVNEQKQGWLCRLGGITTYLFPNIDIAVDKDNYIIYLEDDSCRAKVTLLDDGYLDWDGFDDSGFDSREMGEECSHKFYDPKIAEIEKLYYSSDYDCADKADVFLHQLEEGKYSFRQNKFVGCLYMILFIMAIIAYVVLTK